MATNVTSVSHWSIEAQNGDFSGLVFKTGVAPPKIGDEDVLVELHAASVNYRDLVVAKIAPAGVIPGSDGAGIVLAVGSKVQSLKVGDKVVVHMIPREFKDKSLSAVGDMDFPTMAYITASVGCGINGTLTTHGSFHESCLVKLGEAMTFAEAATLTCSGITAWNALMGLESKKVKKGDWVLTQGTGGVSIAALQFALAAGANVVATTSSASKADALRKLGAHHVINYRENREWGVAAKQLTPNGHGFDTVVDVAGNATLAQSLLAVHTDGLVVLAGMVGGGAEPVPLMAVLGAVCNVRGVVLGTRQMMKDMLAFIEEHKVKPTLDDKVFPLSATLEAFTWVEEQKHFSKVVVQIK